MRVLLTSNLLPPDFEGGQEISAFKTAKALRERGHEVEVVTSRFRPDYQGVREDPPWVHRLFDYRLPEEPALAGWLTKRIDGLYRIWKHERGFVKNYRSLKAFIQSQGRFDIAYVFGLGDIGSGIVMAPTEEGIPVLHHCGDAYLGLHWPIYHLSRARVLLYATVLREVRRIDHGSDRRHIAFVSKFLEDQVRSCGYPLQNTYVLPRGIEFTPDAGLDRERDTPFTFMMAARITPDKGFAIALEAAKILHSRSPALPWRLEIFGKPDEAIHPGHFQSLLAQSEASGVADRIVWHRQVSRADVLAKLRRASAFISSSTWGEPFGNTLIEAMGSGVPLIGSNVGAILEIVTPEKEALIYDAQDPTSLADQMTRVLEDGELRRRLSLAGAERVRSAYTLNEIMDRTERLLSEIATKAN